MKCVAIKGAKELSPAMITDPVSKNDSVVIKVNKCGICGSDIHYWVSGVSWYGDTNVTVIYFLICKSITFSSK